MGVYLRSADRADEGEGQLVWRGGGFDERYGVGVGFGECQPGDGWEYFAYDSYYDSYYSFYDDAAVASGLY